MKHSNSGPTLRASLRAEWVLGMFCACVAAIALLYNLFGNPDIVYDEAAYTWTIKQVALAGNLVLVNQPLFIHPPMMFLTAAAWLRLTGYAAAPEPSAIYSARLLSASVGVADVLLVAAMTYRLTPEAKPVQRRALTGLVAVLTAFEPVLVRYDRQDVIEPFAMFMGMIVLHAAWSLRNRRAFAYVWVVGLLGGLTLLTNEIAVFLVFIPVIFALLERNGPLIRRALAAFGISLLLSLTFLLWAVELGLADSLLWIQTSALLRLIGLIQVTGFNMPGVSLADSLVESVKQYSSSYIILALGLIALIWFYTRRNTETGNFLAAWLTASYALAAYIAAVGTLNVNFFVYPLPGCIVGTVLVADALIAGWVRRRARTRLPLAVGAIAATGLAGLSCGSWIISYGGPGDGVAQVDRYIATRLPGCAIVNASGDPGKYSYLLGGRYFGYFSVGSAALADGIHYFLLAPTDATEHSGDMTPVLESWIEDHGRRLATYPSSVYRTVQLWEVPASPYDPGADLIDIHGGAYVNTVSSHCGGYTVTNGKTGSFYSQYETLGGKGVVGDPVSRVTDSGRYGRVQVFDGVVLARKPGSGAVVRALPIVAMLAKDAPSAYRRAGLPPVQPGITTARARHLLTNPAITRLYLGSSRDDSLGRYMAAVTRYGKPLGPPASLPGRGVAQAFADIVLEVSGSGEASHAVTIAPAVLAAGLLRVPAQAARPQSPSPLPLDQYASYKGLADQIPPAEPTRVKPFVLTLAAALACYGIVVAVLAAVLQ